MFNFLMNYQIAFQSGCTILYSNQSWMKVPIPPYACQYLLFFLFDCRHSSGCEIVSHYGFDLHVPNDK